MKMTSKKLNQIPELLHEGKITTKEAVNQIITFISHNYPIFGLQKYDEDFRSDVLVLMLERGEKFLSMYNCQMADFFTYLYCFMSNLIHTKRRILAKHFLKENLTVSEGVNYVSEINHKYTVINYNNFEKPKIPYSFKPISAEYLRQVFAPLSSDSCDKKILVLALKSCFYITDDLIKQVCRMYTITLEDLYLAIQYCKESVLHKTENHEKAIERRNFAYYHHKKYNYQLNQLKNMEKASNEAAEDFIRKNQKYLKSWINLNKRFQEGYLYLRPTSRTIAEILGISERLVSYYISRAKLEYRNNCYD